MRPHPAAVVCALALSLGGANSSADQPTLLNIDSGSLGTAAASYGGQDFQLEAVLRGVTASGAARVPSPFGWTLNADTSAVDEVGERMLGPIDLLTGAVNYADSQLALPAIAAWPIGISYNSAQTSGHVGGGFQGVNWFQSSQPSITAPDSSDHIVRLFYAANAFVEYKQIDSSSYYAGINGAGGVMKVETVSEGEHAEIQLYTLMDQAGNEIVFFGHSGLPTGAMGQLWKYTVAKGTTGTEATAYVGNATLPYTAATSGYSSGHIVTAYDSAGHVFDYAYTTVGGADRLTSVTAKASGGSPTIATVEYAYYRASSSDPASGTVSNTSATNGTGGDLALVRVTLPTSFPASGSSAAIEDIRENRFYYDGSSHRLKLVLGYEGTRQHLVAAGSSTVSWDANATTLGAALNKRAELRVAYNTATPPAVASVWFAGMDGSGADSPDGEHQVTYEGNGGYTSAWKNRTIVTFPKFSRYAGSSLAAPGEAEGHVWRTQYFDQLGQPLSSVASDVDPASTGGSPRFWVTGVVRDADHRLIALHSPANCSGYNHNATSSSRGSFTTDANIGLVTSFERKGSASGLNGIVFGVRRHAGQGSTPYASAEYVSYSALSLRDVTPFGGSTATLHRPYVTASRTYPQATTNPDDSSKYNETTYTYGWFGSTIVPQWIKTTLPAVAVAHNGTGAANYRQTWFNHYGQAIVSRMPNKRIDTSEYDAATGLLVRQVTDAETPGSTFTLVGDLPTDSNKPEHQTFAGETVPYKVKTEYARDALGRVTQTTANPDFAIEAGKRVSQSYYTRLSDRRLVRMDVPTVDTTSSPVYCGPVSAVVVNHAGVVEESGAICLADPTVRPTTNPSRFTTTADPRSWLADPTTLAQGRLAQAQAGNTAGNSAALVSLSVLMTSPDGSRVIESKRYTTIPTSAGSHAWLGDINTNYDRALARYNGMGLVDREQDFTDTIERPSFDVLGRVVQRTRGTVETGSSANMHPYASIAYDATGYGVTSGSGSDNLNIGGGNGQVTQLFQHPSGAFGGTDDIHSYIRYDGLGNPTNMWRDGGPFLASSVDNLGRVTAGAAFEGSMSSWNAGATAPTATSSGSGELRLRHAETMYDELGRTYQRANYAVDPSTGADSTAPGDTVYSRTYWGANNVVKATSGTTDTQTTRNRLCQPTGTYLVCVDYVSGDATDHNTRLVNGDLSHSLVVAQTNYYYDPTHTVLVASVNAQRGTANVTATGVEPYTSRVYGPLLDVPYQTSPAQTGWMQIAQNSGMNELDMSLRSGVTASRLMLNVQTTNYDALMMVPLDRFNFGDTLRHGTPPTAICCSLAGCTGSPFPSGMWPYIQTQTEYDPRLAVCKTQTTDWESGDRTTKFRLADAAGQTVQSMEVKWHVTPPTGMPGHFEDENPLSTPPESNSACCNETQRVGKEWDKGRLKLEKMFLCDPMTDVDGFNPLDAGNWCVPGSGAPSKDTGYGYPDHIVGFPSGAYPWTSGSPGYTPNDNNVPLWTAKPIGAGPLTGWNLPASGGVDDTDWHVHDYLGRLVQEYDHAYRSSSFGDQNAVSGVPAKKIDFGPGGSPSAIHTPSGDHLNPWEHQIFQYDALGRLKQVNHSVGGSTPSSTPDDAIDYGYDKFGMVSSVTQTLPGAFPSGSGSQTLTTQYNRQGTPQQSVSVGGIAIQPWQGPRLVNQVLPVPNMEVGMAYFPDPSGTTDTTMFPPSAAGGGYMPQIVEPRLDWAIGRPQGIWLGDTTGTGHYNDPLAQYGYVGMEVPLWRFMPQAGDDGLQRWEMLPTGVAPGGKAAAGGGMVPLDFHPPDWRHRVRDDLWQQPIDIAPSPLSVTPLLQAEVDGHKEIGWMSGHITSLRDPATSPSFPVGTGVPASPVPGFAIHGHDEQYGTDCNGRTAYWVSGQMAVFRKHTAFLSLTGNASIGATTAWQNGLGSSATGVNTSAAAIPDGVTEMEVRWNVSDGGCTSSGGGAWMMAPTGAFSAEHPLSPTFAYPTGTTSGPVTVPPGTEWQQHTTADAAHGTNSRTSEACRRAVENPGSGATVVDVTPSTVVGELRYWPVQFLYDAAGNTRFDGRRFYQYDGTNRLKEVWSVAWGTGGSTPTPWYRLARFDYDGLGRLLKAQYDTNGGAGTEALADEDTEWTPRDQLGRPIGIWRQPAPTTSVPSPRAVPYQLFAYHNTSMRGEGADDSRGILDCPAIRWRDADNDSSHDLEEVVSYLQDFRGDVTALVHTKNGVSERVRYGATGRPDTYPQADVNFDGQVDGTDLDNFERAVKEYGNGTTTYDPRADLNRDGVIDGTDEGIFYPAYAALTGGPRGNWKLSQGTGLLPGHSGADAGLDNRFGWRGYWYDVHLEEYHVRARVYDPRQGRFLQLDPLGFAAGDQNLYRYANGDFGVGYDPTGLNPEDAHGFWWWLLNPRGHQESYEVHPGVDGNQIANIRGGQKINNDPAGSMAQIQRAYDRGDPEALADALDQNRASFTNAAQAPLRVAIAYTTATVVVTSVLSGTLEDLALAGAAKALGSGIRLVTREGGKWIAEGLNGAKYELKADEAAALEAKLVKNGDKLAVKGEAKAAESCETAAKDLEWYEKINKKGRDGEAAVADATGLTKNNSFRIASNTGADYRVPDFVDPMERRIIESKNVTEQGLTGQLTDFMTFAQHNGYTFELYVNQSTRISSELQRAIDSGQVILHRIDMPIR